MTDLRQKAERIAKKFDGERYFTLNPYDLETLTSLITSEFAEVRREAIEECANIADEWVFSPSCNPSGPCEHIRLASEIVRRIRALLPAAQKEETP